MVVFHSPFKSLETIDMTASIIPSVKLGSGPSHPNQPSIEDIYLLLGDLAAAFSLPITEKVN